MHPDRETSDAIRLPDEQVIQLNVAVECTVCGERIPPGNWVVLIVEKRWGMTKYAISHTGEDYKRLL